MKFPAFCVASILALAGAPALAGKAIGDMHPEEALPDNLPRMASPGPYADFIKEVQEKLHGHGFDAGPVNGDYGTKMQAALAQFQLAMALPASGALDDETLRALGVQRPTREEGATAEASLEPGSAASGATSAR